MAHTFYNSHHLNTQERILILNEGKNLSESWCVDKLDCSKSWSRESINMSFEDIMKKFNNSCHFTIIIRDNFIDVKYGEISFSTMEEGIKYFLWIFIELETFMKLISKYNLKVRDV